MEPETIIYAFDLFGTMIFAITGAVRGIKHRLDLLGVIVLSCCVGVGGGIVRDCIIGAKPVAALQNETYLIICIITGIVVFVNSEWAIRNTNIITICDAIGLGVFTAIGASKGMAAELHPVGIMLTGVITAVGGGVIRDIMVGTVPVVLKSDFYATASLIGGFIFYLLATLTTLKTFPLFLIVAFTVMIIRLLAFYFHIQLPVAADKDQAREEEKARQDSK